MAADTVAPLLIGILLACAALAYVLHPLFAGVGDNGVATRTRGGPTDAEPIRDALEVLESDRATGRVSDDDSAAIRRVYQAEARAEGRSTEAEAAHDDPVEALILRYREMKAACPVCGHRALPGALYCSGCGRRLGEGRRTDSGT